MQRSLLKQAAVTAPALSLALFTQVLRKGNSRKSRFRIVNRFPDRGWAMRHSVGIMDRMHVHILYVWIKMRLGCIERGRVD